MCLMWTPVEKNWKCGKETKSEDKEESEFARIQRTFFSHET